ncbi:PREDICTED: coiled-coil domain-containing protein 42 like-2 [Acromyrmex echinatior]|uniref:Coiled-coil domain-containing protein 42-like protein n=1 Tax=Acromyrmex echinatior TaxID=103372 RepID=F4WL31_ACREC|nr:PREDICTED: coiled-coil domain-containing protein 42 like-2 [Acromyrmex echinatior]EGI64994.1 Coiled-coil domain-containing protein 42-like protein [Acromyrmex echinatior]
MAMAQDESRNLVQRAVIPTDSQKAVLEYFRSKEEERQSIKKYPEWDKARVCPATEVIKTRQELAEINEILKEKREEQKIRRKYMDEQWEEAREQQLQLRQSLIKFNTLVKENVEKRERADQKIKEEHERQEKYKQEIEELEQKLQYMRDVRDKMQQFVGEYRKYQNYLERVMNETDEFQTINEIFNRYETLIETRQTLSDRQDKNLQMLEEKGIKIHHLTETKTQVLMELHNKLEQLEERYDRAKVEALKWEMIVSKIKETAAAKNLELTQVKACCWNIYQQICKRKEIPVKVSSEDVEHQLVHIKRTILELKRIIKTVKKKAREEKVLLHE